MNDLDAINAAIDRMRAFTPPDPYILTIPQDVEPRYHHQYAYQQRQWLEHTPFEPGEHESLQYQTFVFHEPGKSMYMLHNSRREESKQEQQQKAGTGSSTPSAPKKKITLDAYKKKLNGGTPESKQVKSDGQMARKPAAKAPVKGPIERIKIDEEVLASLVGEDGDGDVEPVKEEKGLKRKRENEEEESKGEGEPQKKQKQEASSEKQRPAEMKDVREREVEKPKKQEPLSQTKVSSPAKKSDAREKPQLTENAAEDDTRLPPKLSPPRASVEETPLPPKLSPPANQPLPRKLSPNIPDNISRTLKARSHFRTTSKSSEVSTSGRNLTPPRDGKNGVFKKSPRNGFRANSSSPAIRSDAEERARPASSVPPNLRAQDSGAESNDEIAVSKVKKEATAAVPQRLMVRLKIKKSLQGRWRQLLKMKPRPDLPTPERESTEEVKRTPNVSDARHREQREAGTKGVAQKIGPVKKANGEVKKVVETKIPEKEQKRARDEDSDSDERPAKRKKPVESPELKKERQPSTPDKQGTSSPSATQKATTTPGNMRKDLLSVSMKREQSTDSNINTPSGGSQTSPPDTSAPTSQTNGTAKSTSQRPSTKTPKQAAWEADSGRLQILGRELKHAAQAHLKSATSSPTNGPTKDHKLAAVKSVESLLAYMTAFDCSDEAALAADPRQTPPIRTWRSMQQFFGFVKRSSEAFPPLHGIACCLGVVFNARILDIATQWPGEGGTSRDVLLETTAMMFRAAREAEGKLDERKLKLAFPKSWEAQGKGGYALPMGVTTAPRAATKAGIAMLGEWAEREKLGYELKVEVGKGPGK